MVKINIEKKYLIFVGAVFVFLIGAGLVFGALGETPAGASHLLSSIQGYFSGDANLDVSLGGIDSRIDTLEDKKAKTVFLSPNEFIHKEIDVNPTSPIGESLISWYSFNLADIKNSIGENRNINALIIQLTGEPLPHSDFVGYTYLTVDESEEDGPTNDDEHYYSGCFYSIPSRVYSQAKFSGMFYAWDRDNDGNVDLRISYGLFGGYLPSSKKVHLKVIGYVAD